MVGEDQSYLQEIISAVCFTAFFTMLVNLTLIEGWHVQGGHVKNKWI
jgi:bacteriorhodopsin